MKLSRSLLLSCWAVAAFAHLSSIPVGEEERPFLAVWRQNDGKCVGSETPCLRFAMWTDGRVLYASDPGKWGHDLRRGKISATRVARIKAALAESGVFDLQGTCYLVSFRQACNF